LGSTLKQEKDEKDPCKLNKAHADVALDIQAGFTLPPSDFPKYGAPDKLVAMALMSRLGLQRLSSRIHSKSLISRSSATATDTATSKKVSDRIVKLFAVDFEGKKREVVGLSGQTLLKALTNCGLIEPASHRLEEIDACSAECEVSIAQEWLEKLPPRSYDEEYVLKRNSRARVLNKHSRLGCQVVLTLDLQGMVVAVPEPKPWDTP
ncbi:adrenodoxin-like protein 2, mitochondrial, partial [Juglans microcarpa x Juglans regia]|uniref:adrenodoxin-like protein 2, mitochondrial n=1 Tax=Juglans microcarpa x Juglans regia TaxID=2249226 RepID=UPI001B7DF6E4